MQKKILICLLLVMALLIPNLASCGFGGSDALEIENIGVEILEDGTSKITIKYFDDIEEPVVFYVPAGQMELMRQQEKGYRFEQQYSTVTYKIANDDTDYLSVSSSFFSSLK